MAQHKQIAGTQCVVGVYASMDAAQLAVHILHRAGLAPDHVSVVARHIDPHSKAGEELALSDDSVRDAAIGATLGGVAGVLGDAALLLLTGIGGFVIAGPLLALTGAVAGAFLGAMRGWGVHQSQIHKYEELVKAGKVLVTVDGDAELVAEAERLLKETGADQLHVYAGTDDTGDVDDRPHAAAEGSSAQATHK